VLHDTARRGNVASVPRRHVAEKLRVCGCRVDKRRYLPIISAVRRKPGSLVALEIAICEAAVLLRSRGQDTFHGYEIARTLGDASSRRLLTAYGTLYRALGRLEKMGLLQSRWEDPEIPARENRPGRRLYTLTTLADAALDQARAATDTATRRRARRRLAPA